MKRWERLKPKLYDRFEVEDLETGEVPKVPPFVRSYGLGSAKLAAAA